MSSTPSEKSSSPTTTVSGRITTPAGNPITTAQVWSSTDPSNKVRVDTTDGSYSLLVTYSGSFTITAEDTDGNYQTSDPKLFNDIKAESIDGQDIGLKYGHTTTVSGQVAGNYTNNAGGRGRRYLNNAVLIVEVEGIEATRYQTRMIGGIGHGAYSISNIAHNGTLVIKVNHSSRFETYKPYSHTLRTTAKAASHTIELFE